MTAHGARRGTTTELYSLRWRCPACGDTWLTSPRAHRVICGCTAAASGYGTVAVSMGRVDFPLRVVMTGD